MLLYLRACFVGSGVASLGFRAFVREWRYNRNRRGMSQKWASGMSQVTTMPKGSSSFLLLLLAIFSGKPLSSWGFFCNYRPLPPRLFPSGSSQSLSPSPPLSPDSSVVLVRMSKQRTRAQQPERVPELPLVSRFIHGFGHGSFWSATFLFPPCFPISNLVYDRLQIWT